MSNKITVINRCDDTVCVAFRLSTGNGWRPYNNQLPNDTIEVGQAKDFTLAASSTPDAIYDVALTSLVASASSFINPFSTNEVHDDVTPLYVHNIANDSIVTISSTVSVKSTG